MPGCPKGAQGGALLLADAACAHAAVSVASTSAAAAQGGAEWGMMSRRCWVAGTAAAGLT